MKKQYIYQTFVDLVEYNISRNNHIKQDVQLQIWYVVASIALQQKSLETPNLLDYFYFVSNLCNQLQC